MLPVPVNLKYKPIAATAYLEWLEDGKELIAGYNGRPFCNPNPLKIRKEQAVYSNIFQGLFFTISKHFLFKPFLPMDRTYLRIVSGLSHIFEPLNKVLHGPLAFILVDRCVYYPIARLEFLEKRASLDIGDDTLA